jgi:GTP pyrophosphokinase
MPETYTEHPLLTERFDRALVLASEHHRNQLRKGTTVPYISHLLGVTSLVLVIGGSEDEAIGALLHDAVEDGGGAPMLERILVEFGADVARIVEANSDTISEPKPPWMARKRAYVASVGDKRPDELRVSLADKLHNARAILRDFRTLGDDVWIRFRASSGSSVRWYYRAMYEAFDERRDVLGLDAIPLLDELGRTMDELDRLATASPAPR